MSPESMQGQSDESAGQMIIENGIRIAKLTSDQYTGTIDSLRELFGSIDLESDKSVLVVDLSDTSYIDSTTMGTFIGLQKKCTEAGVQLIFDNYLGNRSIDKILQITGLIDYLVFIEAGSKDLPKALRD